MGADQKPNGIIKKGVDGLVNLMTGLGTSRSKLSASEFVQDPLQAQGQLTAAYQTNWIARRIVDVPANDMVREWRDIKSSDAEAIRAEEDRVGLQLNCGDALSWSRLFGGGAILMITNQDLSKPLDPKKIKKGDLERLITFDRYELYPNSINTWDVLAPNYLMPESYTISNGSQSIHWTHFALFKGAKLPRRLMANTQGWGDSELRKCLEDLKEVVSAKSGIAELMQEANVDVIRRQGLNDELASDQEEAILKRYEAFGVGKSNVHLALLDMEEEYERKTLQLGGVAPVLDTFMTWASGAAGLPLTKLFGDSAKGMNATGEGDERNYLSDIGSLQIAQLKPALCTIDEVLVRSALGNMPEEYDWIFNPLFTQSTLEAAQADQLIAQKDQMYLDMGAVTTSQVQRNLQSNEDYQFSDEDIAAQEELEKDFDDFDESDNDLIAEPENGSDNQ